MEVHSVKVGASYETFWQPATQDSVGSSYGGLLDRRDGQGAMEPPFFECFAMFESRVVSESREQRPLSFST